MAIDVTDSAVSEVKRQREVQGMAEAFLRIGVSGGGCCGSQFALGLDTDLSEKDYVFDFGGLRVAVDEKSFPLVEGRKLDYVDGPSGAGFTFVADRISEAETSGHGCGCGAGGCGSQAGGHSQHTKAMEEETVSSRGGGCGGGSCGC